MFKARKLYISLVLTWVAICSVSCAAQSAQQSAQKGTYDLFKELLKDVKTVDILTFRKPCFECRLSTLLPQDLDTHTTLLRIDDERALAIVQLLSKSSSYINELAKPCAEFYPSMALKFSLSSSSVALLLYPNCKTARLLTEDGKSHGFLNIDPIVNELDQILPIAWRSL